MVYALNGTKNSQVTDQEMLKRIVQGCRDDGDLSLLVLIENHFSSPHQSTLLHRGGYTKGIDSETGFENIQLLDIISDDSTLKRGS